MQGVSAMKMFYLECARVLSKVELVVVLQLLVLLEL